MFNFPQIFKLVAYSGVVSFNLTLFICMRDFVRDTFYPKENALFFISRSASVLEILIHNIDRKIYYIV